MILVSLQIKSINTSLKGQVTFVQVNLRRLDCRFTVPYFNNLERCGSHIAVYKGKKGRSKCLLAAGERGRGFGSSDCTIRAV